MSDKELRVLRPEDFIIGAYETAQVDPRFPNTNQAKNYVDYYRCITAKGTDFPPCVQFYRAYRSVCPSHWTERWDEQRENNVFPVDFTLKTMNEKPKKKH